jgi:glucose/arabinose dehydrogenase
MAVRPPERRHSCRRDQRAVASAGRQKHQAWIMHLVMKRTGAPTPSANRITLLRDTDGDGVADARSTFLEHLNSPFGIALVGKDLYVGVPTRYYASNTLLARRGYRAHPPRSPIFLVGRSTTTGRKT